MERTEKRFWIRKIYKERKKGVPSSDQRYFFQHFRMTSTKFEELFGYFGPSLVNDAQKREPIGPAGRLCVTLRFLVTGDAQTTLASSYRISKTSVSRIIKDTWDALWNVLFERGFMKETWDALWNVLSERGFMKETWDALWNVLSERGFMKDMWDDGTFCLREDS